MDLEPSTTPLLSLTPRPPRMLGPKLRARPIFPHLSDRQAYWGCAGLLTATGHNTERSPTLTTYLLPKALERTVNDPRTSLHGKEAQTRGWAG